MKEKAIQQLLIDNSPPNSDNEVHPVEQDPLTQSALSLIPNSYLNRLDYGNSNSCQGCLKKIFFRERTLTEMWSKKFLAVIPPILKKRKESAHKADVATHQASNE
ncbi:unnamed protein product [Parnassius apollo]|uniref:(apollo) hypothetical protein n=1 Tax=Parnassius apollo TaxID=110799 RepID=A0A8S3XTC1_PARAO|nr:unnamed protein product [Parnassius apollo]